jgi:arylsulfatase A-like enzyme
VAPKKYFESYPLDRIVVPQEPAGYLDTLPEPARRTIRDKQEQIDLPNHLARQAIQAYHASISFADAQVGRILDVLQETGLATNTIVLFTSDHGYHMGEHGHWQKRTLFENATRVPLIISGPGVSAAGESCTTPVEMVDFYPTLAELCGLEAPAWLPGISLVPALKDPAAMPRETALTHLHNGYSLRTPRYRYTEWGDAGEEGAELYDHQADPKEWVNLADRPEQAELVRSLSRQLHERIARARQKPDGVTQVHFENRRQVR